MSVLCEYTSERIVDGSSVAWAGGIESSSMSYVGLMHDYKWAFVVCISGGAWLIAAQRLEQGLKA